MYIRKDPNMFIWCRDLYLPEIQKSPNVIDSCHIKYGKFISPEYDEAYQDIMKGNACLYLPRVPEKWMTPSQCEEILDGLAKHGLLALLTEFFSRSLDDCDYYAYLRINYTASKYNQLYIDAVNNPRLVGLQRLYRGLAYPLLVYLKNIFITHVNSNVDQYDWTLFTVMIIYVCSLFGYQIIVCIFVFMENRRVSPFCILIASPT